MTTISRLTDDSLNTFFAAAVFLFTLGVYTFTMNVSVPFWDAGEYIATSYTLGVPHAPGTPLYVLIGRIFTLTPIPVISGGELHIASIAERVNWFSALSSAVTILFTYLVTVKVTRKMFDPAESTFNRNVGYVAGVVAALLAAFAKTFWDNAVEAEVYAASCALTTFVVWLVMRWEERLDEGNEDGLLLIITYAVGLGVGIHLGVAIAAWAAVIYVFVRRPDYLRRWDYLGWAVVTLSLGAGVNKAAFLVAPAVLGFTLVIWLFTGKLRKLALFSAGLFMLGVSVHLFLIIRAQLNPMINEAAPDTWEALWKMLIRDQYKPPPPWERKADFFGYQFPHMYLRYMWWNFTLGIKASHWLPVLLAIWGAVAHLQRDRRSFVLLGVLFMLLGPAMAFYLNFKVGEVRERDYFFVQNFQFMSIWVGVGGAALLAWVRQKMGSGASRVAVGALAGAMLIMSFLPLVNNFHEHDRRGFYVARDYARNMLGALEPNAFIFTNGDNDTFPLWYLQEVEGFRKDVRVVNLSLLNTNWYIKQLRDLEPTVPIAWSDAEIDQLYPYRDQQGKVWLVKDIATRHILQTNAWKQPAYIGVTVPDQMGLEQQLVMEGLVFRIESKPTTVRLDIEKTRTNLDTVYQYAGILKPDPQRPEFPLGVYDEDVFKDDNTTKLIQNYAAAFSRVALELFQKGQTEEALAYMAKAEQISPYFPAIAVAKGVILEELGQIQEAQDHYNRMMERYPQDWQLQVRMGQLLATNNRMAEALPYLHQAIELAPADEFFPYSVLAGAYYEEGKYVEAADVLQRWLALHPEDTNVRDYLQQLRASLQAGELPSTGNDSTAADSAETPAPGSD